MKKLILIAAFIISCGFAASAQDEAGTGILKNGGDRFSVDIFSDMWQMDSDTNITIKSINPGFNFNYFFNIPLSGKFSMGLGLGVGTHNMHSNAMPVDTFKNNTFTQFRKIPETVNGKNIDYDINKLALAYLDIPLEFRFTTTTEKGKKIKLALGIKGGYLINNHIKYKGTDFSDGEGDIKFKEYKIANLETLRYGATFRFGYANYHVFGYYSLSKLFKADKGPEMYPISLGIGFAL